MDVDNVKVDCEIKVSEGVDELLKENILDKSDDDEDEVDFSVKKKSMRNRRLLSDSDEEINFEPIQKTNEITLDTSDDDDDNEGDGNSTKPYKMRLVVSDDSEDENENNVKKDEIVRPPQVTRKLIDTDSSEESEKEDHSSSQKVKVKKIRSDRSGSESRSSSSSSDDDGNADENREPNISKKNPKDRPPKRMSAKQADEQMKSIKSFSQKLARETNLAIPYHRPKQFTLAEFLNRRNVKNPIELVATIKKKEESSKNAATIIKMTPEEIAAYATEIEQRQKEAIVFFRNESSDKCDEKESVEKDLEQNEMEIISENVDNPTEVESKENEPVPTAESPEKPIGEDEYDAIVNEAEIMTQKLEEDLLRRMENDEVNINTFEKESSNLVEKSIDYDLISFNKPDGDRPTFKGDHNTLIDLDSGIVVTKKLSGPDELFQRFLKHTSKRAAGHHDEKMCLVSTETGHVEVDLVTIHTTDDDLIDLNARPGASHLKLKQTLESQLRARKREEYMKRCEENSENGSDDDDDDFMEYDRKKLADNEEDEEEADEDEENVVADDILIDDEENLLEQNDDEDGEGGEDEVSGKQNSIEMNDDDDENDDTSSSSDEEVDENFKPKSGRILKKFDDSDSDDENSLDKLLLSTATHTQNENDINSFKIPTSNVIPAFVNTETEDNGSEIDSSGIETELLDLCSGRFEDTQKTPQEKSTLFSQTQSASGEPDNDMLEMLCSGTFETQVPSSDVVDSVTGDTQLLVDDNKEPDSESNAIRLFLESSDEETEEKSKDEKVKQRKKKRKRKFNIDEDDDEDDDNNVDDEEYGEEEEEEVEEVDGEQVDHFIEYDSDENEIEVVAPKSDRLKVAANFLDEEAELSESEWGSADEDENDMDKLEMELGDEDEFDTNKIRSELEQIHMRRMLDQDAREIKKIQELLLEDEDAVGRDRKFVWKNVNGGDFSLNTAHENDNGLAGGGGSDDESEEKWRKLRYEREKALNENGAALNVLDSPLATSHLISTSILMNNSAETSAKKKKIFIKKITKTTTELKVTESEKGFLITKCHGSLAPVARGSFLTRDQETLKRLSASLSRQTSGEDGEPLTAVPTKGKHFVFATVSPTVAATKTTKRKSEDENFNLENRTKKIVKNRKIF